MPDDETLERTVATVVLFGVWGAIVLGPMFVPSADPPRYEIAIGTTIVAFTILGKMWDFETERLQGLTITTDGGRPRDDDRED